MNQIQQHLYFSTRSLRDQLWRAALGVTKAQKAGRPCWAHSLPWLHRRRLYLHLRDGSQPAGSRVSWQIPRCTFLLTGIFTRLMLEAVPLLPSCLLLHCWKHLYVGVKPHNHFGCITGLGSGVTAHWLNNFVNSWRIASAASCTV